MNPLWCTPTDCLFSQARHPVCIEASSTADMCGVSIVVLILTVHSRLARRGGVKRISASIYDEVRVAIKLRLESVRWYHSSCHPPILTVYRS